MKKETPSMNTFELTDYLRYHKNKKGNMKSILSTTKTLIVTLVNQ